MDGVTATRLIKAQHPEIVVVGLSADRKNYQVHAMQKAGAFEVLHKDSVAVTELYAAIQRAVASIQPILILEDTPAATASHAELEEKDVASPLVELKEMTERESDPEK